MGLALCNNSILDMVSEEYTFTNQVLNKNLVTHIFEKKKIAPSIK